MNRIVLIGNGFDLAHGIPTSYKDFLQDYWDKNITQIRDQGHASFENEEFTISCPIGRLVTGTTYEDLMSALTIYKETIHFKNRFLKIITEKSYFDNWVDVENEYYSLLKESYSGVRNSKNYYKIDDLNKDFKQIKDKLEDYLKTAQKDFEKQKIKNFVAVKEAVGHHIYRPFDPRDFSELGLELLTTEKYQLLKASIELVKEDSSKIDSLKGRVQRVIPKIGWANPMARIKDLLLKPGASVYFDLIPENTLLLNFNYTLTDRIYRNPKIFDELNEDTYTTIADNHIHGTISVNDRNPIIFGFGDELDDEYKAIEQLNNNEYLENIKSINYLEAENYKKLLEFVNHERYQIIIMGHSCGISDRTLLHTIFEHQNCISIKPYYHQKSKEDDNYSDIVRNISRSFNDKARMRDLVVNKNYCQPLVE